MTTWQDLRKQREQFHFSEAFFLVPESMFPHELRSLAPQRKLLAFMKIYCPPRMSRVAFCRAFPACVFGMRRGKAI
jgi:hypothetical protein